MDDHSYTGIILPAFQLLESWRNMNHLVYQLNG